MTYGLEANSIEELKSLINPALIGGFQKKVRSTRFKKPRKVSIARRTMEIRSKNVVKKLVIEEPIYRESIMLTVFGRPTGYYSLGMKPNWKRMNRYHAYKKLVQKYAEINGIKLPLIATKINRIVVNTIAYFETGVHSDSENVRKGIVDALFYNKGAKGYGDKFCSGSCSTPLYDKENPRVEIEILFPNLQQLGIN